MQQLMQMSPFNMNKPYSEEQWLAFHSAIESHLVALETLPGMISQFHMDTQITPFC